MYQSIGYKDWLLMIGIIGSLHLTDTVRQFKNLHASLWRISINSSVNYFSGKLVLLLEWIFKICTQILGQIYKLETAPIKRRGRP
jgi:hypothetical protein